MLSRSQKPREGLKEKQKQKQKQKQRRKEEKMTQRLAAKFKVARAAQSGQDLPSEEEAVLEAVDWLEFSVLVALEALAGS